MWRAIKNIVGGAGKPTQSVKVLAALLGNPGYIPSTHTMAHKSVAPVPGHQMHLLTLAGFITHVGYTHLYPQAHTDTHLKRVQ